MVLWAKAWRNHDEHWLHQHPVCTAKWKSLKLNDIDGFSVHAGILSWLLGLNWSDSVLY